MHITKEANTSSRIEGATVVGAADFLLQVFWISVQDPGKGPFR